MQMRHFEDVFADPIDPVVHLQLSARGTKPGLAGKWDAMLKVAAGANISSITSFGIPTEHETKNNFVDVGLLIGWDFIIHS
jgi:hypothetical protein